MELIRFISLRYLLFLLFASFDLLAILPKFPIKKSPSRRLKNDLIIFKLFNSIIFFDNFLYKSSSNFDKKNCFQLSAFPVYKYF